jgi:hypothetical protein
MKTSVKLSLALGLATLLAGCAQEPVTVVKTVPALRPSSIYNIDSVYWYQQFHGDFHEAMAASYLAKAKDAEQGNIQKSIYFTKRAITVQPHRAHYLYLIELLREAELEEELDKVYSLLVYPTYDHKTQQPKYLLAKPEEDLVYEYLVHTLSGERMYDAGELIAYAQSLDFSMKDLKERLIADPRFTIPAGSDRYKNLMLYFMSGKELDAYQKSPENFLNFLASIKDTAATFAIDEQEAAAFRYQPDDWYELDFTTFFSAFLAEKKDDPNDWYVFQAKHRQRINDQVQAVVYAIDASEPGSPEAMRQIYHRLVTYDRQGNIISSQVVATQDGEALSLMNLKENVITVSDYARIWKNPYQKDNHDNYVVRKELTGERKFEIRQDGTIQPLEQPGAAEM